MDSETDDHGHSKSSNGASPRPSESVHILETKVSMLETLLAQATERDRLLGKEKRGLTERLDKFVDMLSKEQEKTRQLMLPPPTQVKGSFWNRFRLKM